MSNNTTAPAAVPPPDVPVGLPIPDRAVYIARVHVGVTVPLLVVTTAVFGARLYTKVWPKWRMGAVEWFIVAGYILSVVDYGLLMSEIFLAPGTTISFATASNAIMLAYFAIPVWGWSMTCIKISVALSLLRVKQSMPWKMGLYTLVGFQTVYCVGSFIFVFQVCRPLSDWWDLTVTSPHCMDAAVIRIVSTTGSLINIATDVLLSLTPITFLWRLNRPVRERILVCLLMGLGLFASVASIVKLLIVLNWVRQPGDDLWSMAEAIATWTVTEQFLAIMAACLPFLKPLVQRLLSSMGFSLTKYPSRELYSGGPRGRSFGMKSIPASLSNDHDSEPPAEATGHLDMAEPAGGPLEANILVSTSQRPGRTD